MNDQQIRIAIAEACGWRFFRNGGFGTRWYSKGGEPDTEANKFPDYPNDLNAMHEAEKILNSAQCNEYEWRLGCFALASDGPEKRHFHKTARQRAEAFLRTIGKWKSE